MTNLEKLQKAYREKMAKLKALRAMETRTAEQDTELNTIMDDMEKLGKEIDTEERAQKLEDENMFNEGDGGGGGDGDGEGRETIVVIDNPIYRSRFPLGEQCRDLIAVAGNGARTKVIIDAQSRLEKTSKREMQFHEMRTAGIGMAEAVGEDGGHLVQGTSVIELMTRGWNNNAILSRIQVLTIGASFYDSIGIDEDSRVVGSRGGGVRWYSDAELDEITSSKTKFKKTRWEPKRLTGLYFMSNEIMNDVPALQSEMNALFMEELAYKKQDMVMSGSGSGEALGLLIAPNVVAVAKESGQGALTIMHRNTTKMLARVHLKNMNSIVWPVNQNTMDQLMNMTFSVGTGGTPSPAYRPAIGETPGVIGYLWGYPVIPIEQAETLGTKGDIACTDLSQYKACDRGGVETAVSAHVKFVNNQTAVRFVTHFDGQPKQKKALTPAKGGAANAVSSTVVLATRA